MNISQLECSRQQYCIEQKRGAVDELHGKTEGNALVSSRNGQIQRVLRVSVQRRASPHVAKIGKWGA